MHSTSSRKEADGQHDAKVIPRAPTLTDAEELLGKLAKGAGGSATNRRADAAESDFSAGPRVAAPSVELPPRPLGNGQAAGEPGRHGRRAMRGPFRFLLAAGIGVVATLAWQSYGAVGRHMIATSIPQLGLSSPPDRTDGSSGTVNKDSPAAAVPATAADAVPAQAAALAQATPDPIAPPRLASTPAAPGSAEMTQQIDAMAHDITAMRQSVEQLTAVQSQLARTIAKLQAAEDARREQPAPPPRPGATPKRRATTTPPQPRPQVLAPGPRPLSQSFEPSPPPAPPQPPRPPASMP